MVGDSNGVYLTLQASQFFTTLWQFDVDRYCLKLGGGPVEIGSGVGGLAYSWVLGRRQEKELLNFRPHNVSMVGLGSTFSLTLSLILI